MNPAIGHFEKILKKTVITANDFYGGDAYTHFGHNDSLHSFTAAFGTPQPRYCCFCTKKAAASFTLRKPKSSRKRRERYLLKLTAAWMDWKKYIHPVTIVLNGHTVSEGPLFLENVMKGWPGIYFSIPPEYLDAKNILEITNLSGNENILQKNILLIERAEILRLNDAEDFTIRICPEFVQKDIPFGIQLHLLNDYPDITVQYVKKDCAYIARQDNTFIFKAKRVCKNIKIKFNTKSVSCSAVIDDVFEPQPGKEIFIGIDCDDYRQDGTEEMDRILEHFSSTQMGNFIAFRPKQNRNYPAAKPAGIEDWLRWIHFCREKSIKFQFSGLPETAGTERELFKKEITEHGADDFCGFQIHEPYCRAFSSVVENPHEIKIAENFLEKKRTYIGFVDDQTADIRYNSSRVFCGDPSLLCVYLRESTVDCILCEPVSNSALLFGAARGTGKEFGGHFAPDWYGGFPHDGLAVARLSLLFDLAYAAGGKYLYVESSAFKTNAHSRNDWEDAFCSEVRKKLREFYRYTCMDKRIGRPEVDLAFVFGNLESLFWRPDDRIAELSDSGNWDDVVWGKWKDTRYRRIWQAADTWLPPLEYDGMGKNESLTKMFSGTTYGQVDVVSPYQDLAAYKAIAFLGWNTMDEKIYADLISYAAGGGILFICGCHFDTRIGYDGEPRMLRDGMLSELIGADIAGSGETVYEQFHTCRLQNIRSEQVDEHLYLHTVGAGKVYFFNFFDYPFDQRLIKKIKFILQLIGKQVREKREIQVDGAECRKINYTIWNDNGQKKIYLTNIDWIGKKSKKVQVRYKKKIIPVTVQGGATVSLLLNI